MLSPRTIYLWTKILVGEGNNRDGTST